MRPFIELTHKAGRERFMLDDIYFSDRERPFGYMCQGEPCVQSNDISCWPFKCHTGILTIGIIIMLPNGIIYRNIKHWNNIQEY